MTQRRIFLGIPGVSWQWGAVNGILCASREHIVHAYPSNSPAGNFDALWGTALNLAEAGEVDAFAMIHADVTPANWWLDTLVGEMERLEASLVSALIAIKDDRGVMSAGIADEESNWAPLRRFTAHELFDGLPETFNAADYGYPGGMLLHNNGLWLADLNDERFFTTEGDDEELVAFFDFPSRLRRDKVTRKFVRDGESEDWYFSRKIHELGITNTYVTRKVSVFHRGGVEYPNDRPWGRHKHDEDLRSKWDVTSPRLCAAAS